MKLKENVHRIGENLQTNWPLEQDKVASNVALVASLQGMDAEMIKTALIATIEDQGLTFEQRDLFSPIQDHVLAQVRGS